MKKLEQPPQKKARMEDKTLMAVATLALNLDNRNDLSYTPEERGILLFEAARHALKKTQGQYTMEKEPKEIALDDLKKNIA